MGICIATVNTGHFDFMAVGRNATDAKAALMAGWTEHCCQYEGAERDLMTQWILSGEVQFTFVGFGQCARDGEVLAV